MIVRELLVAFGIVADTKEIDAWEKRLAAAKRAMGEAADYADRARGEVAALGQAFVTAAAAAAGMTGALVANTVHTAEAAQFAERQAQAFGLTAEAYQELRSVFGDFGVDQRDLADLLAQITQQANAAGGGAENIVEAFTAIGVSVEDVKGKKPEEILYAIANGAASTEDTFARLSSVSTLLGEDLTKKTLPLLMQGAKGLDAARMSARELGVVMDEETIAAGVKLAKETGRLSKYLGGLRQELGAKLLPVVTEITTRLNNYIESNRKLLSQRLDYWAARISDGFRQIAKVVSETDRVVRKDLGGWEHVLIRTAQAAAMLGAAWSSIKIGKTIYFLGAALTSVGTAVGALIGAGTLAGLGLFLGILSSLIIAASIFVVEFGALVLVLQDLWYWFKGSKSAIGEWADANRNATSYTQEIARALDEVWRIGQDVVRGFTALANVVSIVLGPALRLLGAGLATVWLGAVRVREVGDSVANAWSTTKWGMIRTLVEAVGSAMSFLADGAERLERVAISGDLLGEIAAATGMSRERTGFGLGLGGAAVAGFGGSALVAPFLAGAAAPLAPGALAAAAYAAPPTLAPAVSGGGAGTTSNSATNNLTFNVQSTDPLGAAEEIRRITEEQMRRTQSAFRGGLR